jgi:multidrug efflux pump subunit AcrA (membrane-fusion protein)
MYIIGDSEKQYISALAGAIGLPLDRELISSEPMVPDRVPVPEVSAALALGLAVSICRSLPAKPKPRCPPVEGNASMNPTETQELAPPSEPTWEEPARTRGRKREFLVFSTVLALAAVGGTFYWLHARQFEQTDDAFVEMHLNPVSSRVDGVVTKVHVDGNQMVKAEDALVELDPRDYEVIVDQAEAALAQARGQVTAQRPNVPITQVENVTNISAAEAGVANARAAMATAEHDCDSASAKLAEAEANNAKAQADLGRYKILIARDEVSQQDYDQVAAAATAQAATVTANRAAVSSARRHHRTETSPSIGGREPLEAVSRDRRSTSGHPPGCGSFKGSEFAGCSRPVGAGPA